MTVLIHHYSQIPSIAGDYSYTRTALAPDTVTARLPSELVSQSKL